MRGLAAIEGSIREGMPVPSAGTAGTRNGGPASGRFWMATTINGTVTTGVTLSTLSQNPLSITATGYVTNTIGSDGVFGQAGYAWTVGNSGTIKTTGTGSAGILLESGGSVTNGRSGLIESAGIGVEIFCSAGSVTNFGTIEGTGSSAIAVFLEEGGTVTNRGLIEGTGSLDFGVFVGSAAATLDSFGAIADTATYGFGVALNARGAVTNRQGGLIAGGLAGVESGTAATVVNYGAIEATDGFGVLLASGGGTLTNAGTISGTSAAVAFSGSGNRVILDRGEVFSGTVVAGSGSDVVELAAGGAGTVVGSFSGFGVLTEDAGASWQMPGHWSFVTGTIAAGAVLELPTTNFAFTGSLANSGTIDIENGASLTLSAGGSGSGNISFSGTGDILQIGSPGAPAALANPITGFAPSDTIDMAGLVANGETYSGGVLTLTNNGNVVSKLTLATTLPNPVFALAADGNGGTRVTVAPTGGTIFTGTYLNGIVLSNPATENPATLAATGYVTNRTTAHSGDAVYGTNAAAWNFTNLGRIRGGSGPGNGVNLRAGGVVANSGYIEGNFAGVQIYNTAGTVVNTGTVTATSTVYDSVGVYFRASGSVPSAVTNAAGGLIRGAFRGVVSNGPASVSNFGTIRGDGSVGVALGGGGSVANNGLIAGASNGVATGNAAGGVGSIVNQGTIEALGSITNASGSITGGNAIQLNAGGVVQNGASGSTAGLIAGYHIGILVPSSAPSSAVATVTNFGTIESLQTAINGFDGVGVQLDRGGSVANYGLISGQLGVLVPTSTGAAGTVSNLGTIETTGSFTVSGTIALYPDAVRLAGGGTVINGQSGSTAGLIRAGWVGVEITNAAGTLVNFGT